MRRIADACCAVHVTADVAVLEHVRLADVHADPHVDPDIAGPGASGQSLLAGDRRLQRVRRLGKDRKEVVSLAVDLLTAVAFERHAQEAPVLGKHLGVALAQRLEQPRRALDVREEERKSPGRELPPGRCGGARAVQRLVLAEDPTLELLQRRARLDSKLVDEEAPRLLVHVECLRLPPRPVEGDHELAPQPFPERLCGGERLELTDELGVAPAGEIGLDASLHAREPELLETVGRALCERVVREVGQGWSAPELERASAGHGRGRRVARVELALAFGEQRLEALQVQLGWPDAQEVSRRLGHKGPERLVLCPVRLEQLAECRDIALDSRLRLARRLALPQLLDQDIGRHEPIGVQEQERQNGALLGASQCKRFPVAARAERTQDPELERAAGAHLVAPDTNQEPSPCLAAGQRASSAAPDRSSQADSNSRKQTNEEVRR